MCELQIHIQTHTYVLITHRSDTFQRLKIMRVSHQTPSWLMHAKQLLSLCGNVHFKSIKLFHMASGYTVCTIIAQQSQWSNVQSVFYWVEVQVSQGIISIQEVACLWAGLGKNWLIFNVTCWQGVTEAWLFGKSHQLALLLLTLWEINIWPWLWSPLWVPCVTLKSMREGLFYWLKPQSKAHIRTVQGQISLVFCCPFPFFIIL